MPFHIEANLLHGEPRLRVFDAASGALRLHWRYRSALVQACQERTVCSEEHLCAARANLHGLMRELFLLSCSANPRLLSLDAAADSCLNCDGCNASVSKFDWRRS